jgi:aspartyl-tRNA(Asn)/glutamyl-tRNA(Gln) amidotransferase subunit A
MTEITKLKISELIEALKSRKISSVEITTAYLDRIKQYDKGINSYILLCEEKALHAAKLSDEKYQNNIARRLEGIPFGIKDLFCTKDVKTTACSHILDGFIPPYEATVTENLWNDGAIMLGKLNMDEFAMGSTNLNSYAGKVVNPVRKNNSDEELVPGGSSGGSAAALAADFCAASLGSDTGGSVRQPAAFCGLVGVKPSYGRCSRYGMIAYASSLDQAGVFARDVQDAGLVLNAIASYDAKDATSCKQEKENFLAQLNQDIKGMRIGLPKEYEMAGMNPDIKKNIEASVKNLEKLGAEIIEVSLPHTHYGAPTYYILSTAEASSNLARYDGVRYGLRVEDKGDSLEDLYKKTRASGFGNEVKRRIMLGTYVLSSGYYDAYYRKAQKVRRLIANDFSEVFTKVDAIITPTTPNTAFANQKKLSNIEIYYNDIFTVPVNLAGLPAISIPVGVDSNNLPIGVQFITPRFTEARMLRIAKSLEDMVDFQRYKLNFRF